MQTYLEVKLIPNLVNASKLVVKQKNVLESTGSASSDSPTNTPQSNGCKSLNDLTDDDLKALQNTYLLICHLVHLNNQFLTQFCDAVVVLNMYGLLQKLFFLCKFFAVSINFVIKKFFVTAKRKLKVVMDLTAILTQILRKLPENCEVVSQIIQHPVDEGDEAVSYVDFLRHSNPLLRQRICYFLLLLGRNVPQTLEAIWNLRMRETLEALVYDSVESVRNVWFVSNVGLSGCNLFCFRLQMLLLKN